MKQVNQVLTTNDYAMFKTLEGNRIVNKLHVKRLKQSFQSNYLLSPILVNGNYQIIDGQHRFEAAKELRLPVNYIVCRDYGLKEVQILNTNMKNWKKEDYLNAYCDLKYPNYLKFREFMSKYPQFGIATSETILTQHLGNRNGIIDGMEVYMRYFEEGKLEIPDFQSSCDAADKILMIAPFYAGFNRRVFVIAITGIFRIEHYSHSKMLDRLNANPSSLQDCSNVSQYKLMIEEIYNFRSREKVSLRF